MADPKKTASARRLRDPRTREPLAPRAQPGYYPGFSTLAQKDHWDEATRNKVLRRVARPPELRFFTPVEATLMQAILDVVIPQDDRDEAHRIPVLATLDDRLYRKEFDGYVFEGQPDEDEAYRLGLSAVMQMSQKHHGKPFDALPLAEQESLLLRLRDDRPDAADATWKRMSPAHFWNLVIQDAASAYYEHPYAWDEIGFGGPAYPRGYMRTVEGRPEPWEKDERRYEWEAPADSRSDELRPNAELFATKSSHGQEGTH